MSNSTPAGWYPDPEAHGSQRYWDGSGWTQHRSGGTAVQSVAPQAPSPTVLQENPLEAKARVRVPWYRRLWVIGAAGVAVGFVLGSAMAGNADVKTQPQYKSLAKRYSTTNDDLAGVKKSLARSQAALTDAKAALGDLPARESALKASQKKLVAAQSALRSAQAAVDAKDKSVTKREKAVGIVETEIAKNTLDGSGLYKVGADMNPGTYKTSGAPGCYYAILNSTDTSDIADNNNIDGQAFVTVRDGQYFETDGCADWILQR